jgi:hypothetical protein
MLTTGIQGEINLIVKDENLEINLIVKDENLDKFIFLADQ